MDIDVKKIWRIDCIITYNEYSKRIWKRFIVELQTDREKAWHCWKMVQDGRCGYIPAMRCCARGAEWSWYSRGALLLYKGNGLLCWQPCSRRLADAGQHFRIPILYCSASSSALKMPCTSLFGRVECGSSIRRGCTNSYALWIEWCFTFRVR